MVIGIVRRDGMTEPLPPIRNVLDDTVAALKAASPAITVVELDIAPLFSQCQSLANALFALDGSNHHFDLLDQTGEPLSPWLQGRMRRKPAQTLAQTRALQGRREALRTQFLDVWKDGAGRRIDAFVCPVAAHPVPPVDRWNGVSYTSSFVLLDLPAGTLPVRAVRRSDLEGAMPVETLGSWDVRNRELWTGVDRDVYLGSPLSIQVVAPRLQERRLLEAMTVVEAALDKQKLGDVGGARL
jgi:Asp-tRNA(Asn)/Glu-tRNA(Gln) amidotransferase A subunit family amidase